ncbi:MAG: amino acid permease, partial [Akkermansiaceae bacterium]|nr:amino acid permease [Akkermansiaceae bacterium]
MPAPAPAPGPPPVKFGTFGGVFTPSTLTILGVIMFLRFGQVVGESGILNACLIVLCAKLITTLTGLSISAIATNTRVKGGGAYYLISRSLGVEFGGSIGVVFYLAQASSVALYVIGFTEAFLNLFPGAGWSPLMVASLVNAVVFICVFIGAGWTIKVQYGILAILALSLVSFFVGAIPDVSMANLEANMGSAFPAGSGFFVMFALFFPAVTGIMAGVNMSGDLKNPAQSIPWGTLAAIGLTAVIYLAMAVLLGGSRPREVMLSNSFVVLEIARWPLLIHAGIFAATLSSALGSMMGAPRILQAFAKDDIFPHLRYFAQGSGSANEPRRATMVTCLIAQAGICVGDLNAIAPIITMFFMVTYGTINLACFYESFTRNPSYRPAFRLSHWSTALLGAVGCVAVMLLMDPLWAVVGILLIVGLQWQIRRKEIRAAWGDVKSGVAFEKARKALLRLEEERYHPKNWRPIVLGLSGGAWRRNHLAEFGGWLTAGRGILGLAQVIVGNFQEDIEKRRQEEDKLRKHIAREGLEAFPAVVVDETLLGGINTLLQCYGIGGIRPNTVILGWSEDPVAQPMFARILRQISAMERSMIVVHSQDDEHFGRAAERGTIDIWWKGGRSGTLILLLVFLLT